MFVAIASLGVPAIADDGRDGEVRYLGEIDNSPDAVRKLVAKLTSNGGPPALPGWQ
jgi:hypothetical protein